MYKIIARELKLWLSLIGVALLAVSNTFHKTLLKIEIDHLLAEIGALLLVVGILHFIFEMRLRDEMIREISLSIFGNDRIHSSGLVDCLLSSKDIDESAHWRTAPLLTIGTQYSPRFFDDYHWMFRKRAETGLATTVLVLDPDSAAAKYLKSNKIGIGDVKGGVERIRQLVGEANDECQGKITVRLHSRILRYSFIQTNESIWIKFYVNSNGRVSIPALKVTAESPLYEFFNGDIERLLKET